ncbi:MAG: regulatory protein GemA [Deltaproteobacteria bacterium]|nr:regulatory protein GemA [Deltaproteobacteria bacterium]
MMKISKGQIKKIKVLQRAVGLGDDGYREMLWGVARVKSCKDLKGPKISLVIKHLEKCLGKQGSGVRGQGSARNLPLKATEAQLLTIRRLWGRVSRAGQEWGPESAQAHQALKAFLWGRFKAAAPEWLTLAQAQRVIEAIKAMGRREQACNM